MPDFWKRLSALDCRSLVIVAPHPDDEVFGLGGIMTLSTKRSISLTVVAVTDGEASHAHSKVVSAGEIAERRLTEIGHAYEQLGIRPVRVRLGLPDGGVTADRLTSVLRDQVVEGCVLLAPLSTDGHPDHDACGQAAEAGAKSFGVNLFSYPVWAYHRSAAFDPDAANAWRIDLTPAELDAKRRAMACFSSQFLALGPAPEDGPVLAAGFKAPFTRPFEMLYS